MNHIKISEVEAYQTSDGKLFTDDREAHSHQVDIIGQMLDDLIPDDDRGNITRSDRHNILMKMLNDVTLCDKIKKLHFALTFNDEG